MEWSVCNTFEDRAPVRVPNFQMNCSHLIQKIGYQVRNLSNGCHGNMLTWHDDVIKWKHFPRYWPFVRGGHRSTVDSPHKGQWHGTWMFSLISAWTNSLVKTLDTPVIFVPLCSLWRHCNDCIEIRPYNGPTAHNRALIQRQSCWQDIKATPAKHLPLFGVKNTYKPTSIWWCQSPHSHSRLRWTILSLILHPAV